MLRKDPVGIFRMSVLTVFFIIVTAWCGQLTAENIKIQTSLDEALKAAKEDPSKESVFYQRFFNTELFIPIYEKPEEIEARRRAEEGESFSPLIFPFQGIDYIPLFDTEEKLADWAQKEIGFIALAGYDVIQILGSQHHWILNPGTDYVKEITPREIEGMKDRLQNIEVSPQVLEKGMSLTVSDPGAIPPELVQNLKRVGSRNNEIDAIIAAKAAYGESEEKPQFIVVVRTGPLESGVRQAIQKDIILAVSPFTNEEEFMDLMFDEGDGAPHDISELGKTIYQKN